MTKDLQVKESFDVVTKEKIADYLDAFGLATTLDKKEQKQFIEIAQAYNLNPFKREIYCIPYNTKDGRKLSIITGYEVYIKRAERTGKLNGWNVSISGESVHMVAKIVIYRKDWAHPFEYEVEYSEYVQKNYKGEITGLWKTKPKMMLKKVAISTGFRMCFSDEIGGIPYSDEEMPDNMTKSEEKEKDMIVDYDTAIRMIEECKSNEELAKLILKIDYSNYSDKQNEDMTKIYRAKRHELEEKTDKKKRYEDMVTNATEAEVVE